MSNIQLASNLRYLRKQHNMTQECLSEILNISRQAYSNYETSKRTPDLDTLLHLAQFYNVSLDDLVLGNLKNMSKFPEKISESSIPYFISKEKETGNSLYLTGQELDLITDFRSLSLENKKILTGFLIHANSDSV